MGAKIWAVCAAHAASAGSTRLRALLAALVCAVAAVGCSALFPTPTSSQAADDGAVANDGGTLGDTGDATDPAASADTATAADTASCSCPSGQVMRDGACVPNPLIGCTLPCLGKAPSACPSQSVCDEEAAHQPCATDQFAPACVPQSAMGFPAGDLRIQPTQAAVGQEIELHALGGEFYIGALMWWVRIGGEVVMGNEYEARCDLTTKYTPKAAGVLAVEVGYGGGPGNDMNQGWTLAGFLAVGDVALGVQPGMVCGAGDTCAVGGDWTCGCVSGRCACDKAP